MPPGSCTMQSGDAGLAHSAPHVGPSRQLAFELAIFSLDRVGRVTSWSEGAHRLLGFAAEEVLGRPCADLHNGAASTHDKARRILNIPLGASAFEEEVWCIRKDGSEVLLWASFHPVPDADGRPIGATVVARDITASRLSEEALHHSEARLSAVLETAVDAIITIDGRGIIQTVNSATVRMFGYSVEEMYGRNVKMLMPSPYREEHDGYIDNYRRTGKRRIIGIGREVEAQHKDGRVFPVDLAVSEVEPGVLYTGIIRDATERKTAQARLREADRMASIGTLAAGLGHDMNNVLLPVRAHLNVAESLCVRDEVREQIKAVQKSVAYLQQLADGLHYLAMDPESGDGAAGRTDLRTWWEQTGALLRKAVPKSVEVTASIPADVPEVTITPHALTQAILNLIVNAGEAIQQDDGGHRGRVRLIARSDRRIRRVHVSVSDNGPGMPPDVQRRAFDMFFTTKSRAMGTGLGLAMVRRIADRAGGEVCIDSSPGKGAVVTLSLPQFDHAQDGSAPLTACLSVADGRAGSLIQGLLQSAGCKVRLGRQPGQARVWIVDPDMMEPESVARWKARREEGRIVLFGTPPESSAEAWKALDPILIRNRYDLDDVRDGLTAALLPR